VFLCRKKPVAHDSNWEELCEEKNIGIKELGKAFFITAINV